MKYLSTKEAAEILGVRRQAVNLAIARGKLPAIKIGRDWFLTEKSLAMYQSEISRKEKTRRKLANEVRPLR